MPQQTNKTSGSHAYTQRQNKAAEKLRNLSDLELAAKQRELNDQLFRLKFQLNMGQTESLKKIRGLLLVPRQIPFKRRKQVRLASLRALKKPERRKIGLVMRGHLEILLLHIEIAFELLMLLQSGLDRIGHIAGVVGPGVLSGIDVFFDAIQNICQRSLACLKEGVSELQRNLEIHDGATHGRDGGRRRDLELGVAL